MKANAVGLLAIFEKKMRLEVPLFQRQYVWTQEKQWEPLWEDVARKFAESLEGREDAPIHFLGAMVLDQKQTPVTHVERRQIIDGQQRLATMQILLAALRDFCREQGVEDLAAECEALTFNRGMMANPEVDKFKVWPTQGDRAHFSDVMTSGSRGELEKRHPLVKRKYARKPDRRPKLIEAYFFFFDQTAEFFLGNPSEPALAGDMPLPTRLEVCFTALKNELQVVAIDLEQGDDAQVIFETLNARGEPLLPADLLRNFIFLRAARLGEPQESLYEEFWRPFDDEFWREEVKQGRLLRPRSDLFIQHFLASRLSVDIPVRHLYVEYKLWIEAQKPFSTVREELASLARQGSDFRRIIQPKKGDALFGLATFLDAFDIRTAYPLLLALMDAGLGDEDWEAVSQVLESYLLRRAMCGLTTKNYNRVFLTLTRAMRRDGYVLAKLQELLSAQSGESVEWPTDEALSEAWRSQHAYQTLSNPKIVCVLKRLNNTYHTTKMEDITIDGPLSVEHILPQEWVENWPLADGTRGLKYNELWTANDSDPKTIATRARNSALQTIGNLTILTQPLNSAASNSAWPDKKREMAFSLLPINQLLQEQEFWNEDAIARRGEDLLSRSLRLWPRG